MCERASTLGKIPSKLLQIRETTLITLCESLGSCHCHRHKPCATLIGFIRFSDPSETNPVVFRILLAHDGAKKSFLSYSVTGNADAVGSVSDLVILLFLSFHDHRSRTTLTDLGEDNGETDICLLICCCFHP